MWTLIVVSLLTASGVEVQVQTLDGETCTGKIVDFSTETLSLTLHDGDRMVGIRDLMAVIPTTRTSAPEHKPQVWVELIDDSDLVGQTYSVTKGNALIDLLTGGRVTVPTSLIRSVLFNSQENLAELRKEWEQICSSAVNSDTIVIRKQTKLTVEDGDKSGAQTVYSLDTLEGVLRDVTAQSVQFDFDGETIPVKRTKLEGILYYHPPGGTLPDSLCRLCGVDGSTWYVKSFHWDGQRLGFESSAGIKFALRFDQIAKLDFSAGNAVYLSDITPASVTWEPFFATGTSSAMLAQLFQPRMDRAFGGGKLTLYSKRGFATGKNNSVHDKSYDKGLAVHSRTELEYLLTGKFKTLRATAGIDPHVRRSGHVRLIIAGDRQTLFEGDVTGDDDEPVELDLDVTAVRRLKILVDFGEQTDIADHLNLCNARLTK